MDFILDLIGRFHPLIVHLPIGFIVIGLMSDLFLEKKGIYSSYKIYFSLGLYIINLFHYNWLFSVRQGRLYMGKY